MIKRLRAFRVEDDLWDQAIAKSQKDSITVSDILRDALDQYVKPSKVKKRK